MSDIRVSIVPPAQLYALRHRVLRQGLPLESAMFEGDGEPTALHFAAMDADDGVIGCCTLLQRPWDNRPAWQLRGMAVDEAWRGRDVGKQLLVFAEQTLAGNAHSHQLWCNARKIALGFYAKQGWTIASEEFDIPTAGVHRRMVRTIVDF